MSSRKDQIAFRTGCRIVSLSWRAGDLGVKHLQCLQGPYIHTFPRLDSASQERSNDDPSLAHHTPDAIFAAPASPQQLHTPTTPSLLPSTRNPSLILTRSTTLGRVTPSPPTKTASPPTLPPSLSASPPAFVVNVAVEAEVSKCTPAPQSHCLPSARSYTFTTSSPAAATMRRASNCMEVMGAE